jgi:hypothetical protein
MDKSLPLEDLRFNYVQMGRNPIWRMDIFQLLDTIPTVPTTHYNPIVFKGHFYCQNSRNLASYMLESKYPTAIRRYLSDVLGKPIIM